MITQFSRTELILGKSSIENLSRAHVAVFGIGGVGGSAAEALVRAGVGAVTIVDNDTISLTNLNRQLVALHSNIGMLKTDAMKSRLLDINPDARVIDRNMFFSAETAEQFDFSQYDYVLDAIDTVSSKLLLIESCQSAKTPIISSMGTGAKLDPTQLEITDIYKTSGCPLARIMRKELRKRGVKSLTVVYSPEEPTAPQAENEEETTRRSIPGTVSFVPPVAGYILAGKVIRDIAGVTV